MIFTALSPNTQFEDFVNAFIAILNPFTYKDGHSVEQVGHFMKEYFKRKIFLFESGRTALYEILRAMELKINDEILVSSFTCVAAVNPPRWNSLKISYVDIETQTFNISLQSVKAKVTSKTKVILVQHTFGYPAEIEKIVKFARKENILVIEDCAHTIGAEYKGKKLGTFGDAAIFSFGREKAISGSFGGVALVNNHKIQNQLENQLSEKNSSNIWIARQLLYTITSYLVRKTYDLFNLGKLIHFLFKTTNITQDATTKDEKRIAGKPKHIGSSLPNAFARVAFLQLQKLDQFNDHRNRLWKFYQKALSDNEKIILPKWMYSKNIFPLRYPILVKNDLRDELVKCTRVNKIELGQWYDQVVAPKTVNLDKLGYKREECPKAESVSKSVVNLPMGINISRKNAKKIVEVLNRF